MVTITRTTMKPLVGLTTIHLLLPLTLMVTRPFVVEADYGYYYDQGAKCSFVGNSLFVPNAKVFDDIVTKIARNAANYPNHDLYKVSRGGANGAPGALYNNPQAYSTINDILASGDVELLAMTAYPTDFELL